jgi:hypothetical protein
MPKPKRENFGFRLTILIMGWLLLLLVVAGDVIQGIEATDIVQKVFFRAAAPLTLAVVLYKTQLVQWTWRFITNTLPEGPSPDVKPAGREAAATQATDAKTEQLVKDLVEMLTPPTKRDRFWDVVSYLLVPVAFALYLLINYLVTGR